jgi:hypothetical protein
LVTVAVPLRLVASNAKLAAAWSAPQKLGCVVLLAAIFGFVWIMLARPRDEDEPLVRLVLLVSVALGSAVVIMLSGTLIGGQLCAVLASALIGTAVGQWVIAASAIAVGGPRRPISIGATQLPSFAGLGGVAAVVTVALGGLIVLAMFYAELSPVDAALLFLSLIAAGGPRPGQASSAPGWFQASIRVALAACPLAIAIVRNWPLPQ